MFVTPFRRYYRMDLTEILNGHRLLFIIDDTLNKQIDVFFIGEKSVVSAK